MVKKLLRVMLALALAANTCITAIPSVSAETLEDCTFEMQSNYKTVSAGDKFKIPLVNLTGKNVTWTSSDETVASVAQDGTITAKKEGYARITATTDTAETVGDTKECNLTVTEKLNGIKIVEPYIAKKWQNTPVTFQLTLETEVGINPSDVNWSSSNAGFCTVDENGLCTIKGWDGNGNAVITATYGSYSDTCMIYGYGDTYNQTNQFTKTWNGNGTALPMQYMYFDKTDNTYKSFEKDDLYDNGYGKLGAEYGRVQENAIFSQSKGEGVLAFRAPYNGTVNVTVNANQIHGLYAPIENFDMADIGIYHNNTQKYFCDMSTILSEDTKNYYPPTITSATGTAQGVDIAVKRGDYVYVRALLPEESTQAMILIYYNGFVFNFTRTDEDASITAVEKLELSAGGTASVNAVASKTDSVIKYMSSDETVATVSADGTVTATSGAMGKSCVIYSVASKEGVTYAGTVTTVNVSDSKLVLNKSYAKIALGETITLKGVFAVDKPYAADVTYTSSDKSVASVNGGVVTANKVGTAYITAAAGGKTAGCGIEVYDPKLYFEENYFNLLEAGANVKLNLKGTLAESAELKDYSSNTEHSNISYTFDKDTKVFTVNNNANNNVGSGLAEVVATATDSDGNEITATATIVIGSGGMKTDFTTLVTANEIADMVGDILKKSTLADHYLWKFAFAEANSDEYTLMPYAVSGTERGKRYGYLEADKGGDRWYGAFLLSSTLGEPNEIIPGRIGSISGRKAVLVFRAPKTGTVNISADTVPNLVDGNPALEIKHNGESIFKYDYSKTEKFASQLGTITLNVNKGEEILFVVTYDGSESYWKCQKMQMNNAMFKVNYSDEKQENELGTDDIKILSGTTADLPAGATAVSSDESVAKIENGKIIAGTAGTAKVTIVNSDKTLGDVITVKVVNMMYDEAQKKAFVKPYKGGSVFVAAYDDSGEKLTNVAVYSTDENKTTEIPVTVSADNVKIFFWNNMTPIDKLQLK